MKRAAAVGTLCFVVALAACGAARIVVTVDVLSFLRSQGLDAFSFGIRGGVPQTDLTASRLFSVPSRFGPGRVDSVQVTAGAILESTQGGGTVTLDVFFAKDEAGLFIGQPYVSAQATVSGVQTDTLLPPTTRSVNDTVFSTPDVWVGVRARFATDPGPDMVGRLAVTVLQLRSEEHTSELQSRLQLVCRLLLEKKNAEVHSSWKMAIALRARNRSRSRSLMT